MPLCRAAISVSQLAEMVGVEPAQFVAIERRCHKNGSGWYLVTEGDEMQTTGTFPQAHDNTSRKGPKKLNKKGKRSCRVTI